MSNAPSLYSYKNPKAYTIKKKVKAVKEKKEFREYIIEAKGNINIISKSKIRYYKPMIQKIISIFLRASFLGLKPVS